MFYPQSKVINDLFGNDIRYIIPEYQRPYSWDCIGKSEKNNQVNIMWDDLYAFYLDNKNDTYFLGSMVLIGSEQGREFQVIDGQQRLTTLVLLFVSIKCFLKANDLNIEEANEVELKNFIEEAAQEIDRLIFNKKTLGVKTIERKVKIARNMGFDYDEVFQKATECSPNGIDNKKLSDEQQKVARRYFKNRDYFVEQLKKNFLANSVFTEKKATELNQFINVLKNSVSVVRIMTEKLDIGFHIFEILNNRGLPLANKDLFRNFLINQFDILKRSDIKSFSDLDPNKKWYELEEVNHNLSDDFIGRFVESKKGSQQRYSSFTDLQELYANKYHDNISKKKIQVFHEDLLNELTRYTLITNPEEIDDAKIASKLKFLINAGNERYSINLVMALFRYKNYKGESDEQILNFLTVYESYFLSILLGSIKRFSNAPIYSAIQYLNEKKFDEAIQIFQLSENDKIELKANLNQPIKDNDIAKLLISKYVWSQEADIADDDVTSQFLYFDKATLEHIIPQDPKEGSNWINDFSKSFRSKYTYLLGNMTLLTGSKNSAARNFDFSKKKNIYEKTKLAITRELLSGISEDIIIQRHDKIVTTILNDIRMV